MIKRCCGLSSSNQFGLQTAVFFCLSISTLLFETTIREQHRSHRALNPKITTWKNRYIHPIQGRKEEWYFGNRECPSCSNK
jgi:hypothetical protein